MITTRKAYAENDKLLATLNEVNERVIKDPSKTYLVWKGSEFPNSTSGSVAFKAPAGCTIDWGDGNVETFEVESTVVNTHTYTDRIEYHLISLLNYNNIGSNTFYDCDDLISVAIGNGITSIGHGAFYACSNLVSVIIGTAVTSIGYSAFYDCGSLTSIIIPYSVTSIENGAFSSCSSLSNIMIGDDVPLFGKKMSIGDEVFYSCRRLTSVTIGNNVISIGKGAFKSCRYLKIIKMLLENPPTLSEDLFNDTPIEKIIVPKSAIDTYKSAAIWSTYADKIVYETDSSDLENLFWLSGGKQLPNNVNLNNYTTVGNYFHVLDVGSNVTNLPTNAESAFTLKVTALNEGNFIQQQLRDISGYVYTRTLVPPVSDGDTATWSEWSLVLTSETYKSLPLTRDIAKQYMGTVGDPDVITVSVYALIKYVRDNYATDARIQVGDTAGTTSIYRGIVIEGLPILTNYTIHVNLKSRYGDAWITVEDFYGKIYQCFWNSGYDPGSSSIPEGKPVWKMLPITGNLNAYERDKIPDAPTGDIGSTLQPVYLAGGVLTPCTYAIEVRGDLPDTPDANKLYFITDGL